MKFIHIFLFIIFLASSVMSQEKPKLIYFGDPMCSWCYGFAPELEKVVEAFSEKVDLELVMGGLRPYNTQTMVELKGFLTEHWQEVNHRSGQVFKYDILDDKQITYDTEPPSRAVLVVRSISPKQEMEFFKEVQKLFYEENKNLHLEESYFPVLQALNIDKSVFKENFNSENFKQKIKEDFAKSGDFGVRGFPTVMLKKGADLFLISNGYALAEDLIKKINSKLDK